MVMSISGWVLRSTAIHAPHSSSPAASSASVRALAQPHAVLWAIAISTLDMPAVISAAAVQLTRPGERTGDSGMRRQAQTAATTMAGSGIQNSQ